MRKNVVSLILTLLLTVVLLPQNAFATERTVRVAFLPDMFGFYKIEENGTYSGYNYDYLMNVAQHTKWNYEFVVIEEGLVSASLAKAQEMLQAGELDLLGPFTVESTNFHEFESGDRNYGIYRYNLFSARNNYAITRDNYFLKEELRVALVNAYEELNQTFLSMMEEVGVELDIVYVDTHAQTLEMLLDEEVDAIINLDMSSNAEVLDYLSTIQRIPFYFVSTLGNTELMAELDEAIEKIEIVEPDIHQKLLEQYFGTQYGGDFLFTDEEETLLRKLDSFRVGVLSNEPPYQYVNSDGENTGITIEILDKLEEILGIPFEVIWFDSDEELQLAVAEKQVDIIGTLPNDYTLAHTLSVVLTNPYLSSSAYWLRSVNEKENPTVLFHFVSSNIPFFDETDLSTTTDIDRDMRMLENQGTVSIFCDPYVTEYYMNLYQYENIEVQAVTDVLSEISLGVAGHIDVNLVGMLNRAILYLDSYEIDEVIFHHTSVKPVYGFWDFCRDHFLEINLGIMCFSACIVISVYNTSKKFRDLSRRDSLTKLFNSGYFHEYVEEKVSKTPKGALILIDIDYFKEVNDTYGHHTGDEIIKEVAKNMIKYFNCNSFNARVGGDEFAIFLEGDVEKGKLESDTASFIQAMDSNDTGISTTLSIGGYFFKENTDYKTLYKNADEALYKVKEKGRNAYLFEG